MSTQPTPTSTPIPTSAPSWTLGDVTVHRIDEILLPPATGSWLLPDATPDLVAAQDWLRPHFADDEGNLRLHSHSFAFTLGGRRILVDTGIGNGKTRANPPGTTWTPTTCAISPPPDSPRTRSTW